MSDWWGGFARWGFFEEAEEETVATEGVEEVSEVVCGWLCSTDDIYFAGGDFGGFVSISKFGRRMDEADGVAVEFYILWNF